MIPDWLKHSLANPPAAGAGIHAWLFSTARQLHAHMPPGAVEAALAAATAGAARRVTGREIRDAVANSHAVAWTKGGTPAKPGSHRAAEDPVAAALAWPAVISHERKAMLSRVAKSGVFGVADLWEQSPRRGLEEMSCADWLDILFPGAAWLCLAKDHPATARTRQPEKWSGGRADGCGLVVPSPMTGPSGKALDGRASHRCLDNTGPRRWLVIEFDSGTLDEQACLHWYLAEAAEAMGWPRLALVVSSGGKSLHGWYGLCGEEEHSKAMMEYAVLLGADHSTWVRCQPVRLPAGLRRMTTPEERDKYSLPEGWEPPTEVRQTVIFFNPTITNTCNTRGNINFMRQDKPSSLVESLQLAAR